jgi:hypothetical protein
MSRILSYDFRQRNGGQRIDTDGPSTLTSELLELPAPVSRVPRMPPRHQPVHQAPKPARAPRQPDPFLEHRAGIQAEYSIPALLVTIGMALFAVGAFVGYLVSTVRGAS